MVGRVFQERVKEIAIVDEFLWALSEREDVGLVTAGQGGKAIVTHGT
jgi:hypothetical protein